MEVGKAVGGKVVGAAKVVGGKIGDMASSTKGIFGSLVKKFGSAGKWIFKLGSKLIMPLVTTPIGWAILAGLAIGGLAYVFWDDLKKIWGNITGFVSETFSKVSEFASSMVGSVRSMLGNFLRSVGAGMIADWIDPDGADKKKPAKEFTFGNLMGELWNVYTGIWKKVLDLAKSAGKAVGKIAASFARKMGFGGVADWIEEKIGDELETRPSGGVTQEEADAAKEAGRKTYAEFLESEDYKSTVRKDDGTLKGESSKKKEKKYQAYLKGPSHGTTADEPGTGPEVTKPPMSDFKVKDYGKQFPNLGAKNDELMKKGADRAATQIRKDVIRGNLPYSKAREALESLGMGEKFVKRKMPAITHYAEKIGLIPAQSPDDKMNVMNNVNKQNQNAKSQQAGSSPIIIGGSTSNSATSNSNLNTFSQAGAHPNKSIVTSMVSKK